MSHYHFWLSSQLQPESSAYNIPSVFKISGPLDISALERSIDTVLRRHEVFRITFANQAKIRHLPPGDQHHFRLEKILPDEIISPDELKRYINEVITRPFDLETGPLIRALLIRHDTEKYVLVIVIHHIISDLRSKEILGAQISACYDTIVKKRNLPSLASPFLFSSHVSRRSSWKTTPAARYMLEYWQNETKGIGGAINLPLDHPRPPVAEGVGKAHFFALSRSETDIFHEYCQKNTIAPFVALLSCYIFLLARYSNQNRIVVGVPLTNRRTPDDKDTVGCFMNILPLVIDLHKELTLFQVLHLVRRKLLQAHRNQEISFHEIVEAAKSQRVPSYNPIFQVGFTYEPPMDLQLAGLKVESEKWHNQGAQLDLFLNIFSMAPTIKGYFEYNENLFNHDTIAGLSNHYELLAGSLHRQAEHKMNLVQFISAEERNRLLVRWNDTATDFGKSETVNKLIERQTAQTPENTAVVFAGDRLTYRELNEKANQLAHYLIDHGACQEGITALFMERSLEMVIAIYAILKTGGAYVPLEPDLPPQRLAFILEETRVKTMLTQEHLQEKLSPYGMHLMSLDTDWQNIDTYPRSNPGSIATPDNLAYVIYTSGSTGRPKGVLNEHRGLYNRLRWMQETFQLTPGDRVIQKTPYSFDVSVWEFFWPLMTGATLVVPPPNLHRNPIELCRFIQEQTITTIHFVPSMLRLFLDTNEASECTSLKRVFCSGEALSAELRKSFFRKFTCELHNLYGPTEAAIDVSHWDCRQEASSGTVPIGYPIANNRLYILDENLDPVPQGTVGELYIGGAQVARGYLAGKDLTAAAFIHDPFDLEGGGRLYKTGDLARYLADGSIEYLGRVDYQVKLYGNRIELAEIEAVLRRYPEVKDAVVLFHNEQNEKHELAAYLIWTDAEMEESRLRKYLLKHLPYYMIPGRFIVLEEFPLTASGKVDRKSLSHSRERKVNPVKISARGDNDYISLVQSYWQRILKRESIELQCNFFDAGGNSLLAAQLAFDLEHELGVRVPLIKIFQYPTISGFAGYLNEKSGTPD